MSLEASTLSHIFIVCWVRLDKADESCHSTPPNVHQVYVKTGKNHFKVKRLILSPFLPQSNGIIATDWWREQYASIFLKPQGVALVWKFPWHAALRSFCKPCFVQRLVGWLALRERWNHWFSGCLTNEMKGNSVLTLQSPHLPQIYWWLSPFGIKPCSVPWWSTLIASFLTLFRFYALQCWSYFHTKTVLLII